MASLSDLAGVYAPSGPESAFSLAQIEKEGSLAKGQAGLGRERVLRNFNRFDLPNLLGGQAARGAFSSTGTDRKREQLSSGAGDQLTDIEFGLANTMAGLGSNALLAQTGIRL